MRSCPGRQDSHPATPAPTPEAKGPSTLWPEPGPQGVFSAPKSSVPESSSRRIVEVHLDKTQRPGYSEFHSSRKQLELKDIRSLFFFSYSMVFFKN